MTDARLPVWLTVVIALTCVSKAAAQPTLSSLAELKVLGQTNSNVTVTSARGEEFRGTIADASSTTLSVRIAGAIRQFPAADVRSVRVRQEDSLGNGALIGAAIGGGLTSLAFLDNECRDDSVCYGFVAVYTGLGALIGLGVDALIHRNVVVYTAPAGAGQHGFTISPLFARGRAGVRLNFGF